jgi:hypothetical protein
VKHRSTLHGTQRLYLQWFMSESSHVEFKREWRVKPGACARGPVAEQQLDPLCSKTRQQVFFWNSCAATAAETISM